MKIKSHLMTLFLTKTLLKIRKLQSQKQPFNSLMIENPTLKVLADVIIFLFRFQRWISLLSNSNQILSTRKTLLS